VVYAYHWQQVATAELMAMAAIRWGEIMMRQNLDPWQMHQMYAVDIAADDRRDPGLLRGRLLGRWIRTVTIRIVRVDSAVEVFA